MPYQYKGRGDLIWQPDTKVQTFPSGLVLVQRTAIVARANVGVRGQVAEGAQLPCNSPAIDGVFIFPAPQEHDEGGGFVRFDVSGYGRTKTTGQQNLRTEMFRYSEGNVSYKKIYQFSTFTTVLKSGEYSNYFQDKEILIQASPSLNIQLKTGETSRGQTNYGRFSEEFVTEGILSAERVIFQ